MARESYPEWIFIDVGWHRRTGEKWGFPPTDEPEIRATLDGVGAEEHGFDTVAEALVWARWAAPLVLVRLGPTDTEMFSAGALNAKNAQVGFFPEWPPAGWAE